MQLYSSDHSFLLSGDEQTEECEEEFEYAMGSGDIVGGLGELYR